MVMRVFTEESEGLQMIIIDIKNKTYAPINVKPHLAHPMDMWGLGGAQTLLVVVCPAPWAELRGVKSWSSAV